MLLHLTRLVPKGDTVVQVGSTSQVGQSVIQIANAWGVNTINVIRQRCEEKKKRCGLWVGVVASTNSTLQHARG